MHRVYLSIIAALVAALIYLAIGDRYSGSFQVGSNDPTLHSIAVLRFVGHGDAQAELLADTLSEGIISGLVPEGELRVAARSSSFSVHDVTSSAARALGVQYLLEGSVRLEGTAVRVTVQLLHGETAAHSWSQSYDGNVTDIPALASQIAKAVVSVVTGGENSAV